MFSREEYMKLLYLVYGKCYQRLSTNQLKNKVETSKFYDRWRLLEYCVYLLGRIIPLDECLSILCNSQEMPYRLNPIEYYKCVLDRMCLLNAPSRYFPMVKYFHSYEVRIRMKLYDDICILLYNYNKSKYGLRRIKSKTYVELLGLLRSINDSYILHRIDHSDIYKNVMKELVEYKNTLIEQTSRHYNSRSITEIKRVIYNRNLRNKLIDYLKDDYEDCTTWRMDRLKRNYKKKILKNRFITSSSYLDKIKNHCNILWVHLTGECYPH